MDSWDWVNGEGTFTAPDISSVRVLVNGQPDNITGIGFKRRALYAPLSAYDLRIGNQLYLKLASNIPEGALVQVTNNGTVWPITMPFVAVADPLRCSPAIHVNQEGYLPAYPKKAIVGYYLGNLGEMTDSDESVFHC